MCEFNMFVDEETFEKYNKYLFNFRFGIKYNKYLAKIISFIGPLTFGVYLIHEHTLIRAHIIRNLFAKDSIFV